MSITFGVSMDDGELREVGNAIERGDEIAIGQLDVELTVTARPIEDNTGALLIEAEKTHHPEQGVVTSVVITLDHPSGGDDLMIDKFEMEERSDAMNGYHVGERLERNTFKLEQLSIVD